MDLPHRSAIHNFHEPTYDRINTTRYRYCPFGSTPKDPIDYTRVCIKCRWTLKQASMALNQITLDAGGLITTGEPITYRTQYGWAPWITNMHQPLKNHLLSAYQHCYKETIFGMPIMTKLQQLPHYSISSLTQLSSTLTHIVSYVTPLDSTPTPPRLHSVTHCDSHCYDSDSPL